MARVDPAVAAARTAVRAALSGLGPDDLVLVACSGGADSLALAAAVAFEARRVGRSVRSRGHAVRAGAVIVDHGLQAGSADVAARAAAQCRALGLDPVLVRRPDRPDGPDSAGPEAAARAMRYGGFEETAAETGARRVLLGHTLDDQAEQVLLGLARGAGARSLAGMPRERGIFARPFLGLRRAQTEAVCAASGLDFWTDPTNLLPTTGPDGGPAGPGGGPDRPGGFTPLRSQVRGRVLPVLEATLGPGVAEALARTADQARDDADLLDSLAADLLARAGTAAQDPAAPDGPAGQGDAAEQDGAAPEPGERALDVGVLAAAHPALRRRALRLAALAAGCRPTDTTTRHVDALDAFVVSWSGQGPAGLPGGARARRACGRLFLRAAPTGTSDGWTGVRPPTTTQE
ncbi:tRNA lysidine(34) synthetase TilS [Promicromonospora sp. NPDC019610]|uniref:tRNA lysidine(34) synthetase TilS n=1 Tax=Promicromonospora sp. NPDC019610 TaxID=3364405 RepID=UPI00378BA772